MPAFSQGLEKALHQALTKAGIGFTYGSAGTASLTYYPFADGRRSRDPARRERATIRIGPRRAHPAADAIERIGMNAGPPRP